MMNQNNPMLLFRQLDDNNDNPQNTLNYNFSTGLWQEQNGQPVIELFLNTPENTLGETLLTKTREGIDRSENSYM